MLSCSSSSCCILVAWARILTSLAYHLYKCYYLVQYLYIDFQSIYIYMYIDFQSIYILSILVYRFPIYIQVVSKLQFTPFPLKNHLNLHWSTVDMSLTLKGHNLSREIQGSWAEQSRSWRSKSSVQNGDEFIACQTLTTLKNNDYISITSNAFGSPNRRSVCLLMCRI